MRGYCLFVIALLACGCADSGTSTGNPAPKEDAGRNVDEDSAGGATNGGYCEAGEMTPLERDEDSPLGFAMADILAFAEGPHEEAIRWNQQAGLELSPESDEGTIAIVVNPRGAPRFVKPKEPGSGNTLTDQASGPAIGGCVSWIEIDVDVTVHTGGGALDESFEGVLRARDPLTASIYKTLDPTKLGGDFAVEVSGSELEGFVLEDLYFAVRFSRFGAGGTLRGLLQHTSDDDTDVAAGTGAEPFADFGAATCGDNADGFAVKLDDTIEGVTVQDALDLFNADDEADITWETGAMTTSSFAFAPETAGGCAVQTSNASSDLMLLSAGTLTMVSADGRLDATWPGRIEAFVADGSISNVQFELLAKLPSNTEPGANALYGFPTDAIDMFDSAGITAQIAVTTSGIDGVITLSGTIGSECDTAAPPPPDEPGGADPSEPGSSGSGMSGGCAAGIVQTIASGTLE